MNIKFHTIEEVLLLSYNHYAAQVSNNDLLELNGYKIRNILSIVFNSDIKNLILDDLFSENGVFLTIETKEKLFRYLSLEETNELKQHLSNYLNYQIDSDWYNTLTRVLDFKSINTVLIPTPILNHDLILAQLNKVFPKKRFVDWFNYNETSKALILDYNHSWKKRNIFTVDDSSTISFFLKHFFENRYEWKLYNDENQIFKRINTKTRNLIFGEEVLTEVNTKLTSLRPQNPRKEWVLFENDDKKNNSFYSQEEINIYYNSRNSYKYRFSSSFLLEKDKKYSVKFAKDLVSNSKQYEGKYNFSNLENIIDRIDLSELNKAIEKDQSIVQIIEPLWLKFNLNEKDGRLWKQLLQRKSREYGIEKVFSEIEEISGIREFVSLNTFENTYCNPANNTIIPLKKNIFKAICQYLELPLEYRAAMHRERNAIGGHSQELHRKLKELFRAIADFGILDNHKNDDALLDTLHQSIKNIENRVDMHYFGFTREALIYASIHICYEIDKVKLKPIYKIEHIIPN
jgi:hypothetical protein